MPPDAPPRRLEAIISEHLEEPRLRPREEHVRERNLARARADESTESVQVVGAEPACEQRRERACVDAGSGGRDLSDDRLAAAYGDPERFLAAACGVDDGQLEDGVERIRIAPSFECGDDIDDAGHPARGLLGLDLFALEQRREDVVAGAVPVGVGGERAARRDEPEQRLGGIALDPDQVPAVDVEVVAVVGRVTGRDRLLRVDDIPRTSSSPRTR